MSYKMEHNYLIQNQEKQHFSLLRSSAKGYSIILFFRIDVAHKSYTLHKTLFASII